MRLHRGASSRYWLEIASGEASCDLDIGTRDIEDLLMTGHAKFESDDCTCAIEPEGEDLVFSLDGHMIVRFKLLRNHFVALMKSVA